MNSNSKKKKKKVLGKPWKKLLGYKDKSTVSPVSASQFPQAQVVWF